MRRLMFGVTIGTLLVPVFAFAQNTICSIPASIFSRGSRGPSVVQLQQSLINQGLLATGMDSGFFGKGTEAAVKKFQCDKSLVCSGTRTSTGWGVAGKKTMSLLFGSCSLPRPTTDSGQNVSPTSGEIPLPVTVNVSYTPVCSPEAAGYWVETYKIDFGDGTFAGLYNSNQGRDANGVELIAATCGKTVSTTTSHVFAKAGTFEVSLVRGVMDNSTYDMAAGMMKSRDAKTLLGTVQANFTVQSGSFISPVSGAAPLSVSLTPPKEWQQFVISQCATAFQPRLGGRAFSVDWGDGKTYPDWRDKTDTSCGKRHTYAIPGTYVIKARIYDFDDVPMRNGKFSNDLWSESATVTVGGSTSAPTLELAPFDTSKIYKYQEFPDVRWTVHPAKSSDIKIELISKDNVVLGSDVKTGVSYAGEGESATRPRGWDIYDAMLARGVMQFFVRVSLIQDSTAVVVRESPLLTVSNLSTLNTLKVTPESGSAPLSVTAHVSYFHSKCFSYRLDWGDGSPSVGEIQDMAASKPGCLLDSGEKTPKHTYQNPGTYTLSLKSNYVDPFKTLDEIVMIEQKTVTVQ